MSFFSRLRERLTKSSSKIDEGVEALIDAAPAPAEARIEPEPPAPAPAAPAMEARAPQAAQPAQPEPAPAAAPAPLREPAAPPPAARPAAPQPAFAPPPAAPHAYAEPVPPSPAARPVPPEPAVAAPPPPPPAVESPAPAAARPGFFARLTGRGAAAEPAAAAAAPAAPPPPPVEERRRVLDDAMLEGLEELLIAADLGVETSLKVAANIAEGRFGRRVGAAEIKRLLADEVARILDPVARPLPIYPHRPQVVLVVGVNGSGKTTTIGKLASQLRAAGKKVVIAAGDTFRAAAVEQLQIWGDRAGVPVMKAEQGTDPASLAFDALGRAQADGADMLLIDTAGRLQNRDDLMQELAKIVRVLRKKDPTAPHNTVLVLDATTGQNALTQVEIFKQVADVTGLVMTKLDGTAKGGVLVALADRFGLPIHAIGVGESIDDLSPFDPEDFARALTGAS
jgi:fused signal recognition particle receptor